MPGTDVDRLFLDVLPRLQAGVLVHVHDITLPDAYPDGLGVARLQRAASGGALLQGGGYELVFASHYVARHLLGGRRTGILAESLPPGRAPETSLWLRKR